MYAKVNTCSCPGSSFYGGGNLASPKELHLIRFRAFRGTSLVQCLVACLIYESRYQIRATKSRMNVLDQSEGGSQHDP
jgi:hypothetical protein